MNDTGTKDRPESQGRSLAVCRWIFVGFSIVMLAYGVYAFSLPNTDPNHWDWLTNGQHSRYFISHWRGIGTLAFGVAVLSLAIAAIPFARGDRWAWYTLWYWPAFFLIDMLSSWRGLLMLPFFILSIIGLLLPLRTFFPNSKKRGPAAKADSVA